MGYAGIGQLPDLQIVKSGAEGKSYSAPGTWTVAASAAELALRTDEIAVVDATYNMGSDDLADLYVRDGNGNDICWPLGNFTGRALVWIWNDGGVWRYSITSWGTSNTVYTEVGEIATGDPTTGLQWVCDITPYSSGSNYAVVTIGKIKRAG